MTKATGKHYRYNVCFKQKVADELHSGLIIPALQRKYGIKMTTTISRWSKRMG
jgi:hypothetical protein